MPRLCFCSFLKIGTGTAAGTASSRPPHPASAALGPACAWAHYTLGNVTPMSIWKGDHQEVVSHSQTAHFLSDNFNSFHLKIIKWMFKRKSPRFSHEGSRTGPAAPQQREPRLQPHILNKNKAPGSSEQSPLPHLPASKGRRL